MGSAALILKMLGGGIVAFALFRFVMKHLEYGALVVPKDGNDSYFPVAHIHEAISLIALGFVLFCASFFFNRSLS